MYKCKRKNAKENENETNSNIFMNLLGMGQNWRAIPVWNHIEAHMSQAHLLFAIFEL